MQIEVKHYSNIFVNDNPHYPTIKDFGESNTDTSSWRPEISIARAQQGASAGKKLLYDFPDGKDNGNYIQTFLRSPGLDITEVEMAQKRITQIVEDKKQNDTKKAKDKKESDDFNGMIKKIADNFDSSSDSNTSESAPSAQS